MASPAKPEILLLSLSMQSYLDELYSQLIDELSSKATLKRAKSASGSNHLPVRQHPTSHHRYRRRPHQIRQRLCSSKSDFLRQRGRPADHRPSLPRTSSTNFSTSSACHGNMATTTAPPSASIPPALSLVDSAQLVSLARTA